MNEREAAYAAWMNVLGSDPLPDGPVEQSIRGLSDVAAADADSDRLSAAYLAVIKVLAPEAGAHAKDLADELMNAALSHHIRYVPGTPLLIDGMDCSPENVRRLTAEREKYRDLYVNEGTDEIPHWDGCGCSQTCRNRNVTQ